MTKELISRIEIEDFEYKQTKKFTRLFDVGEGGSWCQRTVVHDGILFAASMDHNVYAIEAGSGKEIWKYKTSGRICLASPSVLASAT